MEKLPSLVQPANYYPFLLFQVGSNDAAMRGLRNIKRDFMSLGTILKGFGPQVVFSSILPVRERGLRKRPVEQVNGCCIAGAMLKVSASAVLGIP